MMASLDQGLPDRVIELRKDRHPAGKIELRDLVVIRKNDFGRITWKSGVVIDLNPGRITGSTRITGPEIIYP